MGKRCTAKVLPWFDRVDTKANPVDGISRQEFYFPWLFRPVRFPELILTDIIKFLEKIDDMSAQENDAENIPKDRRAPLCLVTV